MSEIREAREAAGLTRREVCEGIGIPPRTLQNWEIGQRSCPEWEEKLIIAEIHRIGEKKQ